MFTVRRKRKYVNIRCFHICDSYVMYFISVQEDGRDW